VNFAISQASDTSPPVSMSRIRNRRSSVATRRTASSSNDWMMTGVARRSGFRGRFSDRLTNSFT
jgi:hypothetical protein